jgi:hypothetical protein
MANQVVHGRECVFVGGKYYAVRKDLGLADRIARQTQLAGQWSRQSDTPAQRRAVASKR